MKYKELEDFVPEGSRNPLGEFLPEMGEMLNVGCSDMVPPIFRWRKFPFDSVTSPLTPTVVAQLNVAAMLEVDVNCIVSSVETRAMLRSKSSRRASS